VTGDAHPSAQRAVSGQQQPQRRDEIIAAAKKVFAHNGFNGTTIADVANGAELSFGAVYQYFDSKDALFQAMIAAEEHALRMYVAIALAGSGVSFGYAEAPFRATLRATLEFFDGDRASATLLFRDAFAYERRFDAQLGGVYQRWIDDIESLIVAAQKRGDVMAAPSRLVAFTLSTLIGEIAHRRLTTDDGLTATQAADFIVDLVMRGLSPDPSTSFP
jgi:AcrR family transcriptional regulator